MESRRTASHEKQKTRHKIIHSSIQLFSEKGFHTATTKEIARRAQIAEGTLYVHFRSKEDLLYTIGDLFVEFMDQVNLSPEMTPEDIMSTQFKKLHSYPDLIRVILMESLSNEILRKRILYGLEPIFLAKLGYKSTDERARMILLCERWIGNYFLGLFSK